MITQYKYKIEYHLKCLKILYSQKKKLQTLFEKCSSPKN